MNSIRVYMVVTATKVVTFVKDSATMLDPHECNPTDRQVFEHMEEEGVHSVKHINGGSEWRAYDSVESHGQFILALPSRKDVRERYPNQVRVVNTNTGAESALYDLDTARSIARKGVKGDLKGSFN